MISRACLFTAAWPGDTLKEAACVTNAMSDLCKKRKLVLVAGSPPSRSPAQFTFEKKSVGARRNEDARFDEF
jgi:hypothetical protein